MQHSNTSTDSQISNPELMSSLLKEMGSSCSFVWPFLDWECLSFIFSSPSLGNVNVWWFIIVMERMDLLRVLITLCLQELLSILGLVAFHCDALLLLPVLLLES